MKKIFLFILTAMALASCTLYMDEPDEPAGKDNIENGDGFSSPHTDVTAEGTTTYQFNPTTRVFDEDNSQYVVNVDDSVVWLSTSIPYEQLPQVGDGIYSRFTEAFPEGMMAKVASVTRENGMIKCVCTKTSLDHLFKKLDVKLSINLGDYVDSTGEEETLAQMQNKAMKRTRAVDKLDDPLVSLKVTVDNDEFSTDDVNDDRWYSFDKGIRGKFTCELKKFISVDFDLSLSDRTYKCITIDSLVVNNTFNLSGKGGVTLRLVGGDYNYRKIIRPKAIPVGSLPISLSFRPSIEASLTGKVEGGVIHKFSSVKRIGLKKDKSDKEPVFINQEAKKSDISGGFEFNVEAKLGINFGMSINISDKTETLSVGVKPYFEPQLRLEAGFRDVDDMTYITAPAKASVGAEIGANVYAKVNFFEKELYKWERNIANKYFDWFVTRFVPALVDLSVSPNDYVSGGTTSNFLAKVSLTNMDKKSERIPMLAIYNDKAEPVMDIPLTYKSKSGDTYNYTATFATDKMDNNGYVAQAYYINKDGKRYYYEDQIPFGLKIDMDLTDFRQASSYYDFDSRKPYGFEARGMLTLVGSQKVSKWGIRFELYNAKGKKVSSSKCAYFKLKDGKKSWGVKIATKKEGPFKLRAVPFYHVGYGLKDTKTVYLEDKVAEITLDSGFGECTEPDWAEPKTYVSLEQK